MSLTSRFPDKPPLWCDKCECMHSDYGYGTKNLNGLDAAYCYIHTDTLMLLCNGGPPVVNKVAALKPTVASILRDAAATHEQRNQLYASSYKEFGRVMTALFPHGIELLTVEDWNRFGVLFPIAAKLQRYASNFKSGGHKDSAHDMIVYAAMLEELTQELKPQPTAGE